MKIKNILLLISLVLVLSAFHTESGRAKVYIFLSAKCPCAYSHQEFVSSLEKKYRTTIEFTAVFVDKSDDDEDIQLMMKNLGWKMKSIKDNNHQLLKKFHPKVYTDCILVSDKGKVLYHGAIDDSQSNMGQVKNFYLQNAIEDVLHSRPVKVAEGQGRGCLIVR